jgi:hypothetical protein
MDPLQIFIMKCGKTKKKQNLSFTGKIFGRINLSKETFLTRKVKRKIIDHQQLPQLHRESLKSSSFFQEIVPSAKVQGVWSGP